MAIKRAHLLPNVITAFGLSCGLFIIFKMTVLPFGTVSEQLLVQVAAIMLLACFADLLDGAIARAMKAETEFGGLFDSMADAITFGVGPSVVVLKSLSPAPGTTLSFFVTTAAMLFSVAGVLRLVRFNVMAHDEKKDVAFPLLQKKNFFTGLPIPAAAAAAVSLNTFLASDIFSLSEGCRSWISVIAMTGIAYLMISRWRFPSLKNLRIRIASFNVLLITVFAAAVIFYGILHHFPFFFFVISWGYLLTSFVLAIYRKFDKSHKESEEEEENDIDEIY
jgi:CDP-diacylglycerol--serine O-phosphatidyltransferase